MDNLTHTLTGVAISYAGFNRKTRYATLAIVIAANLPDIDAVTAFKGATTYLKYHRGLTHSILGVVVLGALLAGVVYLFGRKASSPKSGPPLHGGWLLLACITASASHLLLDYTNSYGIRPFLPFCSRWYALDIESILDPLVWAILVTGLGLAFLFRLVNAEVGARKSGFRAGALFSLCGIAMLWGLRAVAHRRALDLLADYTYQQQVPERVAALPSPFNPFDWKGVVETRSAYYLLRANLLAPNLDMQNAQVYRKPHSSPAVEAALQTRTARLFMNFARFPLVQEIPSADGGTTVLIRDLRFQPWGERRGGFVATIELDANRHVLSQRFSFSGKLRND